MFSKRNSFLPVLSFLTFSLCSCAQEGASEKDLKTADDSVAYAIGISMGSALKSQGLSELNRGVIMSGLEKALGKETLSDSVRMQADQRIQAYMMKKMTEKAENNRKAGEKFLADNKNRNEVKTTESGLQYEVLKEGKGPKPTDKDTAKVLYNGTLIDGTVFDSSLNRANPAKIPVSGVIPGWQEALKLMPVGSKWKLFIPSQLGYGEQGAGPKIGPNSTLVFEIELLDVAK